MPPRQKELSPTGGSLLELNDLLGPPPVLEGEDSVAYHALWARIREAVTPRDILEEIWARDIVDNLWETLRLRRIKTALLHSSAHEGLERLLAPMTEYHDRERLVKGWASGRASAIEEVSTLLTNAGLPAESIVAETMAAKLDTLERIDNMTLKAEARRIAIFREIDRRREVFTQRLREAANHVEDAEFTELPPAKAAE